MKDERLPTYEQNEKSGGMKVEWAGGDDVDTAIGHATICSTTSSVAIETM